MNAFLEFALLGCESYPKVRNLKLLARGYGFQNPETITLSSAFENHRR
jgi:hypothetical protein